jgi:tRNA threonylcarbamoyladenosine biosynthesis protein TsaB
LLLALDTSSPYGTLGVLHGRDLVAELSGLVTSRHENTLLGRIETVLGLAETTKQALTAIVVGTGPGGFTGVRVGLATAKGLALALRIPIVGIDSLRALARTAAPVAGLVATVVDAHRGEVFGALHLIEGDGCLALCSPIVGTPADVAERLRKHAAGMRVLAVGDALTSYPRMIEAFGHDVVAMPELSATARALGFEGQLKLAHSGADDLAALVPTYVRGADAKLPDRPLDVAHTKPG